jgi:hypothetical protein
LYGFQDLVDDVPRWQGVVGHTHLLTPELNGWLVEVRDNILTITSTRTRLMGSKEQCPRKANIYPRNLQSDRPYSRHLISELELIHINEGHGQVETCRERQVSESEHPSSSSPYPGWRDWSLNDAPPYVK